METKQPEQTNHNGGSRSDAVSGYAPWTPPFKYDDEGQWITDSKNHRVLDIRGWGFLTGKGSEALGLEWPEACRIQDRLGKRIVQLLNEDSQAHNVRLNDGGTGAKKTD